MNAFKSNRMWCQEFCEKYLEDEEFRRVVDINIVAAYSRSDIEDLGARRYIL